VRLQPSNPETWLRLGEYDLSAERSTTGALLTEGDQSAVTELGAAIYLNPESISAEAIADGNQEAISVQNAYVEAFRAANPLPAVTTRPTQARKPTSKARP